MSISNLRMVPIVLLTLGIVGGVLAMASPADEQSAAKFADQATGPVSVAEFQQLHEKLTKMSREKVWSVPWQLSVRKARELAAKEQKPVFLWISSNGGTHPLGPC